MWNLSEAERKGYCGGRHETFQDFPLGVEKTSSGLERPHLAKRRRVDLGYRIQELGMRLCSLKPWWTIQDSSMGTSYLSSAWNHARRDYSALLKRLLSI